MAAVPALKTSDIIFPALSTNFSETLSSLKRSALSISNRLNSITQDADFVCAVADAYKLPLVANERCGSWYIPPSRKAESAYFKSTDGHTGEWAFSLRRLNTQVLDIIGRNDGGMPDALLKTVPIWCCVLNRVLFPELTAHALYTPRQSISESEHSQIEARLDGFVQQLQNLNLEIAALRSKISKPLRPLWVTRESSLPPTPPSFPDFHPIVLCTASRRVRGGEVSEGGYIQGAGDDSEGWSCGLTPPLFWNNQSRLLATNEEDLPDVIEEFLKSTNGSTPSDVILIKPTSSLYVGSLQAATPDDFDTVISCGLDTSPATQSGKKPKHLDLKCRLGKLGSRDLRDELPKLEGFFMNMTDDPGRILVSCATGKDLSLGVALTILCLFSDDNGAISPKPLTRTIDKSFIRQRFSWITTSYPTANPARATLQSINSFLIRPFSSNSSGPPDLSTLQISPTPKPTPEPTSTFHLFLSLSGPWSTSRTLTSALPTSPSGTFTGTATFTPRPPSSPSFSHEYLYEESGTFTLPTGLKFPATKKYAYRYAPTTDTMSVFFVEEATKVPDPPVTGLFLDLQMKTTQGPGEEAGHERLAKLEAEELRFEGRESHLCGKDLYSARYRFGLAEKGWWEVRYDVKGPQKDYVSATRYER
ncbi:uncharacterized protein BDZ99DRAFT_561609 [Mytilinidion resinicola]|uniref:tRNA A64-2'-O-ribosylphosphate transferase n=1 Tax=Mytilinidion resinicola TaxID=574789 RepID=A0A6A6YQX8_9PEZI|nr:uncharacterized protein BDZ99DRAFT_561609 [Mytilinidion resinicola]KAF2810948.1 hypothetical protein BDZ99DRAFT_561609 [Mytilinidion resinicola]